MVLDQGTLYVSGAGTGPTKDDDFLVRAYDSRTGTLLWADLFNLAGGLDAADVIAVDPGGLGLVFAAGSGTNTTGNHAKARDLLIRAYDGQTGALVWHDQFDLAHDRDEANAVAAFNGRVFVAGRSRNTTQDFDLVLRCYDAQTGSLLWQDVHDGSSPLRHPGKAEAARGIAVGWDGVYVVGLTTNANGQFDLLVRAYDPATGRLLWEDVFDLAGGADVASAVALDSGRLVVGGYGTNAAGNRDFLVRAYDSRTGTLLWQDVYDLAGKDDQVHEWSSIAVRDGRAFVVGYATNAAGNKDFLVRAYSLQTGVLAWHDQFDLNGYDDEAHDVTVSNEGVYVGGYGKRLGNKLNALVRAYDPQTGALLWQDEFDLARDNDRVHAIVSEPGRVIAGGFGTDSTGKERIYIRAFDSRTGLILWEIK
jgi:hypothetical protein